jgi:hypothetical protein
VKIEISEGLEVSKKTAHRFRMVRFKFKELNEVEGNE